MVTVRPRRGRLAVAAVRLLPLAVCLALGAAGCEDSTAPPPAGGLEGVVRDEDGLPLAGIDVLCREVGSDAGDGLTAVTGPDGRFRVAGERPGGRYLLRTLTDDHLFWDFESDTITAPAAPQVLPLVRRRSLAAGCADDYYGRDGFLGLLMDLTKTTQTWTARPDRRLLKWDHYPVPVHVAGGVGTGGIDLGEAVLAAVAAWNEDLDEPYLTPVDTIPAVGIRIGFGAIAFLGLASQLEPSGYTINEAVPRVIEITVREDLRDREAVVSIVRHELAHALGMGGHSACPDHLTYFAYQAAGSRVPRAEEIAALRAVRHLPQGLPMDHYRAD